MIVQPLVDRIVLKMLKAEENKTKSGIVLLNNDSEKVNYAEVTAVSLSKNTDGELIVNEISIGDKVIIGQFSGVEINIDDNEYKIVRQSDILAKLVERND